MVGLLLDTNVLSELRKPARKRTAAFNAWANAADVEDTYLSVIVALEIRAGIESLRSRDPHRAQVLTRWFDDVLADYRDRILGVDLAVANAAARLHARSTRAAHDALIAATAAVHGLVVATRNVTDFDDSDVEVVNPWG